MKTIKFLLKFKTTRRLIDSIIKNYFLARNINIFFLNHRNLKLEINMEDSFDRVFLFKGYWEDKQINYLIDYAKKNKVEVFIDVGSNSGLYSLIFSKNISLIKVLSYEPIFETYEKQHRNISLNNLEKNIKVYNYGLSDTNKKVFFKTKTSYNYDQSSTYKVSPDGDTEGDVKIFDEYNNIINKKLIIKIDIEGHELEALKGMLKTFKKNSILLQVEIFPENYTKVNNFLITKGFNFKMKIDSDFFYEN